MAKATHFKQLKYGTVSNTWKKVNLRYLRCGITFHKEIHGPFLSEMVKATNFQQGKYESGSGTEN